MSLAPGYAIAAAWAAWAASWLAAAVWTRRTTARAGYVQELPNRLITVVGAVLVFMGMSRRLAVFDVGWNFGEGLGWILFACVIGGMAFAWWARLTLGTLWSGTVTRKQDHRIVDTGPYAIVRHPIYTGLLFSLYATAFESGRIEPLIGVVLMSIGFWMKASLEEGFLSQELGESGYAAYRARVPMLIPFAKGRA
jgi:protein-S-isoprenylcysteine O-methyltransferase Ste14